MSERQAREWLGEADSCPIDLRAPASKCWVRENWVRGAGRLGEQAVGERMAEQGKQLQAVERSVQAANPN